SQNQNIMPPRKVRQNNKPKSSTVPNPSNFSNSDIEKYFIELQGKTFIQDKVFDPSMILYSVVVLVVHEFYATLRDQESGNTEGHIWDIVPVQGKEVHLTPRIIYDFYNAPYYENNFINETDLKYFRDIDMDNIINFLNEGKGEWKYRSDMFGPTNLEQENERPESEKE
ncbi:hypothetical protein J1N35_007368, partial [Gossypium stocksii]